VPNGTPVTVIGIDHVLVAMPAGGEEQARRFYAGVLGLEEIAKPDLLGDRGGCWFRAGSGSAIHLGIDADFHSAREAHPCLVVDDLTTLRHALREAGVPVTEDASGLAVDRCYVADPFGNRIELLSAGDAGFSLPTPKPAAGDRV
jgi:catechol 2,3-dioxygenase-like lactoylglutathione lyase family enzyme